MVSEFRFIDHIKSKYSLKHVGDDCAVLPKDADTDLLLTADMLVEDVDFRLEWTTSQFLGHKSLAVSLSDVAAMLGEPKWAMLSIAVPDSLWNTDLVDGFYEGWFNLANEYGVELIGGDVSRSPDKLVIDSIVGGEAPRGKAVLRSGARPGDAIFVTGKLGSAAGGLKLLEQGIRFDRDVPDHTSGLLLKQLKPQPQINAAKLLTTLDITSAMDISDGLSSDLAHICRGSGVGAFISALDLPVDPDLMHHFPEHECLTMAMHGGEDLALLFTAAPENILAMDLTDLTRIGEITANIGIIELIDEDGTTILEPRGYRHF